ncbi:MAG: hypothetical protein ABI686_14555 [Acidobacteriota bacterium]
MKPNFSSAMQAINSAQDLLVVSRNFLPASSARKCFRLLLIKMPIDDGQTTASKGNTLSLKLSSPDFIIMTDKISERSFMI